MSAGRAGFDDSLYVAAGSSDPRPMRATTWAIAFVLVVGCGKQLNPEYCSAHPGDHDCMLNGLVRLDAAPPQCGSDGDCTIAGATVCDTSSGTCVQCTSSENACAAAGDGKIVCNTDDTCVECTTGVQCPASGVCDPDNNCAAAGTVLFAGSNAIGSGDCSATQNACTLATAVGDANGTKTTIQLADGDYTVDTIQLNKPGLQLVVAAGAHPILHGSSNSDPILAVTADVTIEGIAMDSASGDGVSCSSNAKLLMDQVVISNSSKTGIDLNGCTLTLTRSRLQSSHDNALDLGGTSMVTVINNFIWDGGNQGLTSGAVHVGGNITGQVRFNTIAFNQAEDIKIGRNELAYPAGFECDSGASVKLEDNLFADNDPVTGAVGFGNPCGSNPDNANWIGDSKDVSFLSAKEPIDLHLTSQTPDDGSDPIRDNANTDCSDVKNDIDGDIRPFNNACDYGADEFTGSGD
jgi:hypothetical protein